MRAHWQRPFVNIPRAHLHTVAGHRTPRCRVARSVRASQRKGTSSPRVSVVASAAITHPYPAWERRGAWGGGSPPQLTTARVVRRGRLDVGGARLVRSLLRRPRARTRRGNLGARVGGKLPLSSREHEQGDDDVGIEIQVKKLGCVRTMHSPREGEVLAVQRVGDVLAAQLARCLCGHLAAPALGGRVEQGRETLLPPQGAARQERGEDVRIERARSAVREGPFRSRSPSRSRST